MHRFSRSHDQCYVDCPRKAYLTYYYGGKGIVPAGLDLYQETGSLTHAILEKVMLYAKEFDAVPSPNTVTGFVNEAVATYTEAVQERGFDQFSGELELEMQRQIALAEGLARVWTIHKLPKLLQDYKVIEVEREHRIPFGKEMEMLSRIDGVLQRRSDDALFAGPEFKTTGWMSEDYVESWRYSVQTLSHCLDVKHVYGEFPSGVLMEFLYKGVKRKDKDGGYNYYSPLVRAYMRQDDISGQKEFGFDGGLARRKEWVTIEPYTMGMEHWVTQLPEEVIDTILFSTIVYRSPRELDEWVKQVEIRQYKIATALGLLNDGEPSVEGADDIMASVFPARLDNFCYSNQYKKKCPYLDVCYHVIDDPLESGVFVAREPHHPGEFDEG